MGIDKDKPYSLCGEMGNRFWIEEWGSVLSVMAWRGTALVRYPGLL